MNTEKLASALLRASALHVAQRLGQVGKKRKAIAQTIAPSLGAKSSEVIATVLCVSADIAQLMLRDLFGQGGRDKR